MSLDRLINAIRDRSTTFIGTTNGARPGQQITVRGQGRNIQAIAGNEIAPGAQVIAYETPDGWVALSEVAQPAGVDRVAGFRRRREEEFVRCPFIDLRFGQEVPVGTQRFVTVLKGDFWIGALGTQRTVAGIGTPDSAAVSGAIEVELPPAVEVCKALLYWVGRNVNPDQGFLLNGESLEFYDLNPLDNFSKTYFAEITSVLGRGEKTLEVSRTDQPFTETLGVGVFVIYGSPSLPSRQISVIDNLIDTTHIVTKLTPERIGFLAAEGDPPTTVGERITLNDVLVAEDPFSGNSGNGFGFEWRSFDVSDSTVFLPGESQQIRFLDPEPIIPVISIIATR